MVAKEQWVTARVLDFDGTGIVVAKKYECNLCKTTYKGWDARLLKALPVHIQNDFDIIVNRNFAFRRSVAKHVRAAVIGRCTFNQISRVFNQTRCTEDMHMLHTYYHAQIKRYTDSKAKSSLTNLHKTTIPSLPESPLVFGSGRQFRNLIVDDFGEEMVEEGGKSQTAVKAHVASFDDS